MSESNIVILDDEAAMLLLKRGARGALIGGVALVLSWMQSHYDYWDLVTAALVGLMSMTHRTFIVSVAITLFLAFLYLFPPEMAANLAAWVKSMR